MLGDRLAVPGAPDLGPFFREAVVPDGANPSLVFDRFLPVWTPSDRTLAKSKDIQEVLTEFIEDYNQGSRATQERLKEQQRRIRTITAKETGTQVKLTASTRLIIGLGAFHPTENSFGFDPLTGVPCIPGSSVKGSLRQWARFSDTSEDECIRLFGSDPGQGGDKTPGALSFLTAFPEAPPELVLEVVTSHHAEYYRASPQDRDSGTVPPMDVEDPNPVYLLSVKERSDFVFSIVPRNGGEEDVAKGEKLLERALDLVGVGAKTAVGYGRFHRRE